MRRSIQTLSVLEFCCPPFAIRGCPSREPFKINFCDKFMFRALPPFSVSQCATRCFAALHISPSKPFARWRTLKRHHEHTRLIQHQLPRLPHSRLFRFVLRKLLKPSSVCSRPRLTPHSRRCCRGCNIRHLPFFFTLGPFPRDGFHRPHREETIPACCLRASRAVRYATRLPPWPTINSQKPPSVHRATFLRELRYPSLRLTRTAVFRCRATLLRRCGAHSAPVA